MSAVSAWQPIETAPRDGTIVLLRHALRKDWKPQAMAWNAKTKQWEGMGFSMMRSFRTAWDKEAIQPDQWAPIPE